MRHSPFPSSKSLFTAGLLTIGVVGLLGLLRWLEIPSGEWMDWLVGISGFWWLLGVTTIPWNVYFGARRVGHDILASKERGIQTSERDEAVAKKIARRALFVAITLHVVTAGAFAALATLGLTAIGWVGAGAALLLTFAQPLAHLYQHLVQTLSEMSNQARYPRMDIETLRADFQEMQCVVRRLNLDDSQSWASDVERKLQATVSRDEGLTVAVHDVRREMHQMSARLSEDTQFLGNVRELIRFVKQA
ncbi:MAG: hypothetical protein H0U74_04670 [Bradymonadaceae bacterium]|nr:hypothetical protein [Lujinxingiaceae bacterium]